MKRILCFVLPMIFIGTVSAQNDEDQIKKVVTTAYIEGIHNHGETADIGKGFHPCFVLLGIGTDSTTVTLLPIYNWIEITKAAKTRAAGVKPPRTDCKFIMIDITGNAAVAKIELWRADKKIFTDYLSLYKFREGWKIVGKIYYRH